MAILAISLPRVWASPIWLCCEVLHSSYVTLRAIIAATARLPAVCCSRWIVQTCKAPSREGRHERRAVVSRRGFGVGVLRPREFSTDGFRLRTA